MPGIAVLVGAHVEIAPQSKHVRTEHGVRLFVPEPAWAAHLHICSRREQDRASRERPAGGLDAVQNGQGKAAAGRIAGNHHVSRRDALPEQPAVGREAVFRCGRERMLRCKAIVRHQGARTQPSTPARRDARMHVGDAEGEGAAMQVQDDALATALRHLDPFGANTVAGDGAATDTRIDSCQPRVDSFDTPTENAGLDVGLESPLHGGAQEEAHPEKSPVPTAARHEADIGREVLDVVFRLLSLHGRLAQRDARGPGPSPGKELAGK